MKNFIKAILLSIIFNACAGGGDLNNTSGLLPEDLVSDRNPPSLLGSISFVSNNDAYDRSPTLTWNAANDDEGDIEFYQISIASDNSDGVCNSMDFTSPLVDSLQVPSGADFISSGYQLVDGNLDGEGQTITLSQNGDTDYCVSVTATDDSNNTSAPIYSSVYQFTFKDCLEILTAIPLSSDGVYHIDPDQDGGDASYDVFCDMSTQGGGWTLAIRYDSNFATAGAYALPVGSGRQIINISEIDSINTGANLSASINIRPIITNGASHFMHVGKANDGATDSSSYLRIYFSEIYQAVLDNPDNLFNPSLDTNSGDGVNGVAASWSLGAKNRWFESNFSLMIQTETDNGFYNTMINGGEGDAMFTNANREGAVYSCGTSSAGTVEGHTNPKVQWGFHGNDGSQQTYGGVTYVGTYCHPSLGATQCRPENRINLMFVR